jgi:hypothetical protein
MRWQLSIQTAEIASGRGRLGAPAVVAFSKRFGRSTISGRVDGNLRDAFPQKSARRQRGRQDDHAAASESSYQFSYREALRPGRSVKPAKPV